MDIRDYLRVIRAGWALLLLGLALGAGVAFGASALMTPQYTASSQLFISATSSPDLATAVQGNYFTSDKVASYAGLLTSKDLAAEIVDELGLDISAHELSGKIHADVEQDTTLIDVTVTDPSPRAALEIAETLNGRFRALIDRIETPPGESTAPVRVYVVASPELPRSPSSPATVPNTVLGAVVGLVLAGLVAVLRYRLDTTVKSDETATQTAGAPVIGHVPADDELARSHVLQPHSASPAAEAVRQIRTNLGFLDVDDPPRVIMVTSSLSAEGKTTVAVNLAMRLAESGASVALVEADLRRPRVTSYLGLVSGAGLTNVLRRDAALEDVVQDLVGGRLHALPSGPVPPNPSELLSSEAMASVVRRLAGGHDFVVIDAPPVLPVADAAAMAGLVDGVLLCVRWGTVTTEQLARSGAIFERLGARLLGLVLTVVPARTATATYGYQAEGTTPSAAAPSLLARLFRRRRPDVSVDPVPTLRPRSLAVPRSAEPAPRQDAEQPGQDAGQPGQDAGQPGQDAEQPAPQAR